MVPDRKDPFTSRQARLRTLLKRQSLSALLVTFLPNGRYLTGFSGTSGAVLVTGSSALFFTDFRYRIQAEKEVKGCRLVEQKGFDRLLRLLTRLRHEGLAFEATIVGDGPLRHAQRIGPVSNQGG